MTEEDHHKEVYARFGLAVYLGQVLETGLLHALVFFDFFPKSARSIKSQQEWVEKLDAFEGRRVSKTMGFLLAELRKITSVPDDLEQQLTKALKLRNHLVHHYFRDEKIMRFLDEEGRDSMIKELEGCADDLRKADQGLEALLEPLYQKYGITREKQQKIYDDLVREYLEAP